MNMELDLSGMALRPLRWAMLALLVVLGFAGCGRMQPAFLGTYVNSAGSELSEARDTLTVERGDGDVFLIHRRTGFRLIREGKFLPWAYAREEWTADYHAATGVMTERRAGKVISFDTERGLMLVGRRKYERVLGK